MGAHNIYGVSQHNQECTWAGQRWQCGLHPHECWQPSTMLHGTRTCTQWLATPLPHERGTHHWAVGGTAVGRQRRTKGQRAEGQAAPLTGGHGGGAHLQGRGVQHGSAASLSLKEVSGGAVDEARGDGQWEPPSGRRKRAMRMNERFLWRLENNAGERFLVTILGTKDGIGRL